MKILVLGGKQAFGPGLADGKSFVGQFVRRLRAEGHPVQVDQYGPLSLMEAGTLLPKLRLHQYDGILLEVAEAELISQAPTDSWVTHVFNSILLLANGPRSARMEALRHQLATVLMLVQPYRQRTLLLSPLPQPLCQAMLFKQVHRLFLTEAALWEIPSVDVATLLEANVDFFQADATNNLNALAHELLGSELHTLFLERTHVPPPRWQRPFLQSDE